MKLLITMFLTLGCLGLYAQDAPKGEVEETKDPEIEKLISKRIALYNAPRTAEGYRVLIYNGGDRETYISMKQKYLSLHPNGKTYLEYVVPNFKLKVGDCATYREAMNLRKKLAAEFKDAAVVKDRIRIND